MRKAIGAFGVATALTFGGGAPVAQAQSHSGTVAQADAEDDSSDNTGLWGLAGLLGLAGLAGLKRRTHNQQRGNIGAKSATR